MGASGQLIRTACMVSIVPTLLVPSSAHRDADRSMLEAGSSGVAMEVTQPAWPLRVARRVRESAIVQAGEVGGKVREKGEAEGGAFK